MEHFFNAESVAVVGVSSSPTNLGRAIVFNLMEFQYQGVIYLVGPKGGVLAGHRIYRDVLELPEPVDLAAVLVPAQVVPEVLRQCGQRGIRRVIVESAGFRELGEERLSLEQQIQEILDRHQMRMIGPNCIGVIHRKNGLAVPFMPMRAEAPLGRVALVSQSGGVGATMINLCAAENVGFGKFASIGNKFNVNENDLLEYLTSDPETEVIFCYLEGIAQGRRLMEIAARSSKPFVVHKSNWGGAGAVIALSHSASLSSDDKVVEAAFRQCGITRVFEQDDAMNAVKGFLLPPMRGRRLAVISRSGGHAVMAADAAEEFGFELPPFPDELIQMISRRARAGVIRFHNPLDMGDIFDLELYRSLAEQTLTRVDIDAVLVIYNYWGLFDTEESRRLIRSLGELMATHGKPVVVCVFSTVGETTVSRRSMTFPIWTDPREALRALALNRDRRDGPPMVFARERPSGIDVPRAKQFVEATGEGLLPADVLAGVLEAYGIPLVPWRMVRGLEALLEASREMGFPVVLKTAEIHVVHKTDAGGVVMNLSGVSQLERAYRSLERFGPAVLLQKQVEPGLEWLVGGRQDDQFGPVVVTGLGGIHVEVFRETAIRVAPFDREDARGLLEECRGSALMQGVRGRPPLDQEAMADLVSRVSWILNDFPEISELDLNPVFIRQNGCEAVDWRAVRKGRQPSTSSEKRP